MKRRATYRLVATRRETVHVNDEFDHTLMLVEMEGEPIEYQVGVAGAFVSRRSVTFHDRIRGTGDMRGYSITTFRDGAIHTRYEGRKDASTGLTTGTWNIYEGLGKLAGMTGNGTFTVKRSEDGREYIMEIDGDYQLS